MGTEDDFAAALREAAAGFARTITEEGPFAEVLRHVTRETTAEEREALLAAHHLGGPAGVCALLAVRFGPNYAWVPFRYVRLRPPRQRYVMMSHDFTFMAEAGWHKVPVALAMECARVNDAERAPVFDVAAERPAERVVEVRRGA